VPRAGLSTADVVAAGAALADEAGIGAVTLALLAERLGVKPPALYKHVASLADLQHRVINSIRAMLAGYGIAPGEADHAIRALRCPIHGFSLLQAAGGFQWSNDPDESFAWMIRFVDAGLRGVAGGQSGDDRDLDALTGAVPAASRRGPRPRSPGRLEAQARPAAPGPGATLARRPPRAAQGPGSRRSWRTRRQSGCTPESPGRVGGEALFRLLPVGVAGGKHDVAPGR